MSLPWFDKTLEIKLKFYLRNNYYRTFFVPIKVVIMINFMSHVDNARFIICFEILFGVELSVIVDMQQIYQSPTDGTF